MEKIRITVWDYRYDSKPPKRYEVDAWCFPGEYGFRAFFYHGDLLFEAAGDDGHWFIIHTMHKDWVNQFKEFVSQIE